MRKSLAIVLGACLLSGGLFAGAYFVAQRVCVRHMAKSTDDLDWLRMEFHLSEAQLARVRKLHEGYLPICERNCAAIAAKKRELAQAVAAGTNSPVALNALRTEVTALRAKCQSEMLAHFEEVSRAMPAEEGRRYLAEMKRLTLSEHEQVEESMSGTNGHVHDHH